MFYIFFTMLCTIFMQLNSAQTDRTVGLNDVPDDVFVTYILPPIIPDFFVIASGNTEEELYNTISHTDTAQKVIPSLIVNLMISKKFYNIIKPKYDAYKESIKNIKISKKLYSIADFFIYLPYPPQSAVFDLKSTTFFNPIPDLLSMTLSHDPSFPFLIEVAFIGQKIPIKSDGPFDIAILDTMPDPVKKLFIILKKTSTSIRFTSSNMGFPQSIEKADLTYSLPKTKELSAEDAVALCRILKLFTTTPSQEPTILKKTNDIFTDLTETFRQFEI